MNLQTSTKAGFFRPTFQSQYSTPRNKRHTVNGGMRLGDLLEVVTKIGEDQFYHPPGEGEFAVIDAFKREKGFFEVPPGAVGNPDKITALIESHFDSPAMRIEARLWMV